MKTLKFLAVAALMFFGATAAQAQVMKAADKTNAMLYDEQWEIARHYPFVEKDDKKRTCAKALVMTHAYSNAIIDKVEEALRNGIVGNEDDDW